VEIARCSGAQFDPELADYYIRALNRHASVRHFASLTGLAK
jgi:hypothetical protein